MFSNVATSCVSVSLAALPHKRDAHESSSAVILLHLPLPSGVEVTRVVVLVHDVVEFVAAQALCDGS